MKNRNHFFVPKESPWEKRPYGENARLWAKIRSPLFLLSIFSVALLQIISCKKDSFGDIGQSDQTTLYLYGDTTTVTNLDLSYDVVIKRSVTFQNGLDANSPGWKKLQAIPETESYSLQVDIDNGSIYLLQDNIVVQSYLEDKLLPEDKMSKMEILNGTLTTYDSLGGIISSLPVGNMAQSILDGIDGNNLDTPIDTNALAADSIPFYVSGNRLLTWKRISLGDDENSTTYLDLNTGVTILEHLYDDNDVTKIVSMASHSYNTAGTLQTSKFTYYDYLPDGDVKRTDEQWDYSNFSLNIF